MHFETPYATFFSFWPPHTKMAKILTPIRRWPLQKMAKSVTPHKTWPNFCQNLPPYAKKMLKFYAVTKKLSPHTISTRRYNKMAFLGPLYTKKLYFRAPPSRTKQHFRNLSPYKNHIFESLYTKNGIYETPYTKDGIFGTSL